MLQARFSNLSRQTLRNLNGFCDRSALGDEARHVGAGRDETALFKRFKMKTDSYFVHRSISITASRLRLAAGDPPSALYPRYASRGVKPQDYQDRRPAKLTGILYPEFDGRRTV